MNDSLNESMSVKRVSKKIKKVKVKYINFSIFLLIVNFFSFFIQKFPELNDEEKREKKILTKNIFLLFEDFIIKAIIITSLIKFKINSIILFSILYFIIATVMIFYLIIIEVPNKIIENQKLTKLSLAFFIINIALFILEGFLLAKIYQLMAKEQKAKSNEKYGFNSDDEMLGTKNFLVDNSF